MKHDDAPNAGQQMLPVRFECIHPTANSVCVAGCFNQWQPEAKPLHPASNGRWMKETAPAPGMYEYCLVVDGEWMPDPLSTDYVPNPFGGWNSVLQVPSPDAIRLAAASPESLKRAARTKTQRASKVQAEDANARGRYMLRAGVKN